MQVCNCPALVHNSTAQDRKYAFCLSAAMQKESTAALCPHSYNCASLHFVHVSKRSALMPSSKKKKQVKKKA